MRLAFKVDDSVAIEHQTKGMPKPMQDFMKGYLDWLAKQTVSVLQDVIRRQVYTWKPLSKNYLEFKKNFGLDTRIWYASGQMLESIKYWYVKGDNSYYIGVHPRKKYRKYKKGGGYYKTITRDVYMIDVIRFMEYGTRKMPARPLFEPTFDKMEKEQQSYYQTYLKLLKQGKV